MEELRGLELLFNNERKNLKSKEDCVVVLFHTLLINKNFRCVGTGDEWPETISTSTELLPNDWNSDQDVYSLRYISKDLKSRVLLKITKMEHILQVDVVKNEDEVSSMSVPVENHIDNIDDYSTTYKDLESLIGAFRKDILLKLQPVEKKDLSAGPSNKAKKEIYPENPKPAEPSRSSPELRREDPFGRPRYPRVGGADLDPFGSGGGMFMDPSDFGIPRRPSLSDFGVGGRGGLPRGAVPPGARFDPIRPPFPSGRFDPDPRHFKPPDFDDYDYM